MRVKFNRGPMSGKYMDVPDNSIQEYVVRIAEPSKWDPYMDLSEATPIKTGTYYRSNVTLKGGAVVFEWMGWKV